MSKEFNDEVALEYYRSGIQSVREVGVMALRTIMTLNSGAFVVLLTFIGNTAAQSRFSVPIQHIKWSMYLFLTGIALTFLAIAYTYIASQNISPYPKPEKRTEGWFAWVVVVLSGLAVLTFLIGVIVVISGVEMAK